MSKKTIKTLNPFGILVQVLSVNGGWSTVKMLTGDEIGKEAKFRNGQLREPTEKELAEIATEKPPVGKASKRKPKNVEREVLPETGDVLNGDGSQLVRNNQLVKPDYDKYVKHDVKSPSGRKALDIDDEAAKLLRGQDISDCYFIVAKNIAKAVGGEPEDIEKELKTKYENLNVGMQRMNLGNRLRKALGTYGNLNAHKNPRKPKAESADRAGTQEHVEYEAKHGEEASIHKYGRRAGDVLKRKSDRKPKASPQA